MTDPLADRLLKARADGDYCPDFIVGSIDLPQALDLQLAVLGAELAGGASVGGWKVGPDLRGISSKARR